mmetsp:Transcript_7565/g.13990  ORF Transcript_7565/g.13990 Transcript_7565/m.13990 type:complete len:129 (-) Transcript_7565:1462-1848(-)
MLGAHDKAHSTQRAGKSSIHQLARQRSKQKRQFLNEVSHMAQRVEKTLLYMGHRVTRSHQSTTRNCKPGGAHRLSCGKRIMCVDTPCMLCQPGTAGELPYLRGAASNTTCRAFKSAVYGRRAAPPVIT